MNWLQIVKEFSACSTFVEHLLLIDFTGRHFIVIVFGHADSLSHVHSH